jgi:Ca2+-transporting ATPase
MGPTCSIVYENEPLEKDAMLHPPRVMTSTFFNLRELTISIFQGLAITAGTLFVYQYSVQQGYNEEMTRSMVFTTLIFANIFLTLVNRSFHFSVFTTLKYKNTLMIVMLSATLSLLAVILYIPLFASFFRITSLNLMQISWTIITAFVSVIWFEVYKLIKRKTP